MQAVKFGHRDGSRVENQSPRRMDDEAAAIARALKVSVAWLFGETR
jgi:hypothetical protein